MTRHMISNERPFPHRNPPYGSQPARMPAEETTLKTERIQVERKTFVFLLKENARGRFLRITEDVNGRRDNIIIPSTGLDEFGKVFGSMVKAAGEIPESEPEKEA